MSKPDDQLVIPLPNKLREIMWNYCCVVRDEKVLK